MPDRAQHRLVGDRIRVRPRRREVDVVGVGEGLDGLGLVGPVAVERELAGVVAGVVDLGPRREHVVDPEVLAERPDNLLGCRAHDHDLAARGVMLGDEVQGLLEDDRGDDLVEGLAHDLRDVTLVPAADHLQHRGAELLHLGLVGAHEHEDDLRVGALDDRGLGEEPFAVEGTTERQDAALGDDRLVEIEEGGLHSTKARPGSRGDRAFTTGAAPGPRRRPQVVRRSPPPASVHPPYSRSRVRTRRAGG